MSVLASVLVQHWLVGGSALNVNQTHLVIHWLAVLLANVTSKVALHYVTPPLGSVSVNLSILESHVISVRLMLLMTWWQVVSHVSVI